MDTSNSIGKFWSGSITLPHERHSGLAKGGDIIVVLAANHLAAESDSRLQPPSDLQKTLDRYKITLKQAVLNEQGCVFTSFRKGASYSFGRGASWVSKVLFPKIPFLSRYIPIVPLASSCFFGVKKTAVIMTGAAIAAGGIGFISGWTDQAKQAIKLYSSKPEDNLRIAKDRLQKEWEGHKEKVLKASNIVLSDKGDWLRIAPEGVDIGAPEKALAGIKDKMLVCRGMNYEACIRFYTEAIACQQKSIQALEAYRDLLAASQDPDNRPKYFSAKLDAEIENGYLEQMKKWLHAAIKTQPSIEGQQIVSAAELTSDDTRKWLNHISESYLAARNQFEMAQNTMVAVQREYVSVLTDHERVQSALEKRMMPVRDAWEA